MSKQIRNMEPQSKKKVNKYNETIVQQYLLKHTSKPFTTDKITEDLQDTGIIRTQINSILYNIKSKKNYFSTHTLELCETKDKKITWQMKLKASTPCEIVSSVTYQTLCESNDVPMSLEEINGTVKLKLYFMEFDDHIKKELDIFLDKFDVSNQDIWNEIYKNVCKLLSWSERLCTTDDNSYVIKYDPNNIIVFVDKTNIISNTAFEKQIDKLIKFGWIVYKFTYEIDLLEFQSDFKNFTNILDSTLHRNVGYTIRLNKKETNEIPLSILIGQLLSKFPMYSIYFYTCNQEITDIITNIRNQANLVSKLFVGLDLKLPRFIEENKSNE